MSISHIRLTLLSALSDDKTSRTKQNGQHLIDNILDFINENFCGFIQMSLDLFTMCHWQYVIIG